MSGFVAYGGEQYNAPGGTINVGTPPEVLQSLSASLASLSDLSAGQRAEIGRLSERLEASEGIVRQVLASLGEHADAITSEALPGKVAELVTERRQMRDRQAERALDPDATLAGIDRDLTAALAEGDDARAEALLEQRRDLKLAAARLRAEAAERLRAAEDRDRAEAAEAEATLGQLALVRLRYGDAAARFRAAADLLPDGAAHRSARQRFQDKAADALCRLGNEFGDNAALEEAVAMFRSRVAATEDDPAAAYNLGVALQSLGAREGDPARLEEAVASYRQALDPPPGDAAMRWRIRNNLGSSLMTLGERETDPSRLEDAASAYRLALEEAGEAVPPGDLAMTLTNLGSVLKTLGERYGDFVRLEQAVEALETAVGAFDDGDALRRASARNNLGLALAELGRLEAGSERLTQAVAAFRAALAEQPRDRVPLDWALSQSNLALALTDLAERTGGAEELEEAVAACRAALGERTRERSPIDWAQTQVNLGRALWKLGIKAGLPELEEAAAGAFGAALEELTRERVPLFWATAQNNLANVLSTLGQRSDGTERLEAAAVAYRAVLEVQTCERVPRQWATTTTNLAIVLATIAGRTGGSPDEALGAIEAALPVFAAVGAWDDADWAESLRRRIAGG